MTYADITIQPFYAFRCKRLIYQTHMLFRAYTSLRTVGIAYRNTAAFLPSVLQGKEPVINRGGYIPAIKIIHAKDAALFLQPILSFILYIHFFRHTLHFPSLPFETLSVGCLPACCHLSASCFHDRSSAHFAPFVKLQLSFLPISNQPSRKVCRQPFRRTPPRSRRLCLGRFTLRHSQNHTFSAFRCFATAFCSYLGAPFMHSCGQIS